MEKNNITTFLLLGFPGPYTVRICLFLLMLVIYLITISGNLLVMTLVSCSRSLHSPMYIFLTQLTTSDMITTSDIVPNMLHILLNNGSSMSLSECMTQMFLLSVSICAENLLLSVMSYDRYLAICKPLNYHSIMDSMFCLKSIIISWIISFLSALITLVPVSQLQFCRSNVIDHFFCDFDPVLKLSCSSHFNVKLLCTVLAFPMLVTPFLIITISYASIIYTILQMQSIKQRKKAFSTCGSHLTAVLIFYGTLFSIYLTPVKERSTALHKVFSLMYCVLTPLMNPVIYCLRNKDIKKALRRFV